MELKVVIKDYRLKLELKINDKIYILDDSENEFLILLDDINIVDSHLGREIELWYMNEFNPLRRK
jgi:hypothetical protein